MTSDLDSHCAEINRCNQRGGRMWSFVDLVEAGTLTPEIAAYSLAAIGAGASFMVGALPGGAGKTTVMGALLNFVPADVRLVPADGMGAIERGLCAAAPRSCFVCHEIGNGPYYAYLWGAALRRYFELPAAGHMLATNLHADTYEQAREQVCRDNKVPVTSFRRIALLYFLAVDGSGWHGQRRISAIWESGGEDDHRQVFGPGVSGPLRETSDMVSADRFDRARSVIDAILASDARTIKAVRRALTEDHAGD